MKKIYTIGRDEECDIIIQDNTDVISRLHATLRVESNDKLFLIDQSRNGTYVNGMKMSSNVEIPVTRKDVISFAHIHELDWSQVPKQKKNFVKPLLITLACIAIIAGIIAGVVLMLGSKPKRSSTSTVSITETADSVDTGARTIDNDADQTDTETEDTVAIRKVAPVAKRSAVKTETKIKPLDNKVSEESKSDSVKAAEQDAILPIY